LATAYLSSFFGEAVALRVVEVVVLSLARGEESHVGVLWVVMLLPDPTLLCPEIGSHMDSHKQDQHHEILEIDLQLSLSPFLSKRMREE